MIIQEIKNIKDTVTEILLANPHLKDDDYKLISTVWFYQLKTDHLNEMSGFDFLKIHSEGKLVCSESIRRCRALLQKKHPELRGVNYKKRKNGGNDFSKEINQID